MEMHILHKIVEALYTDSRIRQFLGKLQPAELREDLLHHVIERIYQYHERHPEKLFMLASKDKVYCVLVGQTEEKEQQLFAWMVGNIRMELTSPRSPFSRKYRKAFEELPKWALGLSNTDGDEYGPNAMEDKHKIDHLGDYVGSDAADKLLMQAEEKEALRLKGVKLKEYNPLQFELFSMLSNLDENGQK